MEYVAGDLPPGAQAFATDTDHYDFRSARCVKDLELQLVRGVDTGDDEVGIQLRHNVNVSTLKSTTGRASRQ